MCVPGFKALLKLATDSNVDLETVELKPVEKTTFEKDIAQLSFHLKKGVQVHELMTMLKEDKFPTLKAPTQQATILDVVNRLERATVNKVLVQETSDRKERNIGIKTIIKSLEEGQESMENIIMDVSREFGPSSEPTKEMAAVGYMLKEGVRCDEVITMVESGLLPNLQKPQAQIPLVSMVAEKGYIGTVCEVLVEESTKDIQKVEKRDKAKVARLTEVKNILKKAKSDSVDIKSKFKTWFFINTTSSTLLEC